MTNSYAVYLGAAQRPVGCPVTNCAPIVRSEDDQRVLVEVVALQTLPHLLRTACH